jgi:hypothetical protein
MPYNDAITSDASIYRLALIFYAEMELFYKPKFCSNCGERIELAEWTIWSSSRFCPLCSSENQGRELLPRVLVVLAVLVLASSGISAISGFVRGLDRKAEPKAALLAAAPRREVARSPEAKTEISNSSRPEANSESAATPPPRPAQPAPLAAKPVVAIDEYYLCGAETKKGTPCSRRVKGHSRCWQHAGMPAMPGGDVPADSKQNSH